MVKQNKYGQGRVLQSRLLKIGPVWLVAIALCAAFLGTLTYVLFDLNWRSSARPNLCQSETAHNVSPITFRTNGSQVINQTVREGRVNCHYFIAQKGHRLMLNTDVPVDVISPAGNVIATVTDGMQQPMILADAGKYYLQVGATGLEQPYEIEIALSGGGQASASTDVTQLAPNANTPSTGRTVPDKAVTDSTPIGNRVYYNAVNPPVLEQSSRLSAIVDEASNIAANNGLPTQNLSIKLIDLSTESFGEFQADKPLFPASVVKLFWLIALFQQYESGETFGNVISEADLKAMMQDSDNNSASRILDALTGTTSGLDLAPDKLEAWEAQRSFVNTFYTRAGYSPLNISQKNFPIPDENLEMPSGREQQMRGGEDQPERNFLTTGAIARLLYEIETGAAVNTHYSQKAKRLMKRDFAAEATKQYDSIRGFVGESLEPYGVSLFSKPGWTSGSRQDAAIIESPDANVRYILVIIGDDAGYADSESVFPEISEYIYQELSQKN